MYNIDKLQTSLMQGGYKVTTPRKRVYTVLANSSEPLSNSAVIDRAKGVDRVSVYRTLELFESLGITHRTWNGFKSTVELSDRFSPHHHHFTCTTCGKIATFKSKEIENALHVFEKDTGRTIAYHVVELNGLCEMCNKNGTD
jgi:Fur family ferric uptake transcriptional regulator